MRYPSVRTIEQVVSAARTDQKLVPCGEKGERWVPARAKGYPSFWQRFHAAWLVWSGQADAVIYPGQ